MKKAMDKNCDAPTHTRFKRRLFGLLFAIFAPLLLFFCVGAIGFLYSFFAIYAPIDSNSLHAVNPRNSLI